MGFKGKRKSRFKKEKPEFDQQIVDLARVTRVTKGGKQLSFRACVVIGDHKGRVGYGIEKGKDVQIAVEKAVNQAKKNMIRVPLIKDTVPHQVESKFKAGRVLIKPAPRGSGIIAGSSIRTVLELAGVTNASAKMIGKTNNKVTNVKTTFKALQSFLPKAIEMANKGEVKKFEKTANNKIEKKKAGNEKIEKKSESEPKKKIEKN